MMFEWMIVGEIHKSGAEYTSRSGAQWAQIHRYQYLQSEDIHCLCSVIIRQSHAKIANIEAIILATCISESLS